MRVTLAVIIPVYNASKYITRCLESCMIQKELKEIVIINDGSTDDSLTLLKMQASKDPRLKIYEHKDKGNHGRSASRNLGLRKCTSTWVTFLDADDYYKTDRFLGFFNEDLSNIDGTYEAVMSTYASPKLKDKIAEITTIESSVTSDQLQDFLIAHREQRISIISLILTKTLCELIGNFDESLNTGEDTDFIWRAVGSGRLRQLDQAEPRIVRQVHEENTYHDLQTSEQLKFYAKWRVMNTKFNLSKKAKKRIKDSYEYYLYENEISGKNFLKVLPIKVRHYLSKIFMR